MSVQLLHGDCLAILPTLPAASVDAAITDPPYGLSREPDMAEVLSHWLVGDRYEHGAAGFMGTSWDSFVPGPECWRHVHRVLKPGAHLLACCGTRTWDLLSLAVRLAGFENRDTLAIEGPPALRWLYGQGFPKSHDVSKAIDARADDACATGAAKQWQGWGTALKPAWEVVLVFRKPLIGTVAENVLAHGTGALNIDACRIGTSKEVPASLSTRGPGYLGGWSGGSTAHGGFNPNLGRWPANVLLACACAGDAHGPDCPVAQLDAQSGIRAAGARPARRNVSHWGHGRGTDNGTRRTLDGAGGASRFLYCAKASPSERRLPDGSRNPHPTVKPLALMTYLTRLVCPPGGTILDPFAGSGTTGIAAVAHGCSFIGIEQDETYCRIARERIAAALARP